MVYQIPVFRAEREAGLAPAILAASSVAFHSPLEALVDGDPLLAGIRDPEVARRVFAALGRVPDSHVDPELFYMKDVLVTSGWNLNGDVFDRLEMFAAHLTPQDKPLNFEHNQADIIGHIVASQAVDDEMAPLPDDLSVEDLPARFHIVNGSVIYRYIGDDDRQKLIEKTIAEIVKGEWFVSMEALFRGFDYAVRDPDGVEHVVARNEKTAFLTAYLRAYPPDRKKPVLDKNWGTGVYVEQATGARYEVGRMMRSLTFCGKGLVRRPGNAGSVILTSASAFTPASDSPVYLFAEEKSPSKSVEDRVMSEVANADLSKLQARVDELVSANERQAVEIAGLKSRDADSRVAGLESELAAKAARVTSLETQLEAVNAGIGEVTRRAEAAEASLASVGKERDTLKAERSTAVRKALLVEKHAPEAVAASLVAKLSVLDDEAFAATVEAIAASWVAPSRPSPTAAIDGAVLEADVALAAAVNTEAAEREDLLAISAFLSENVLRTGRDKSSK